MKSYSFLFWGYNVFWIGIAAYVTLVYVRLRRLKSRVDTLEERVGGDRLGNTKDRIS